ncbi:MAG: GNAT family N-acetyltransferase [Microcystaceae cyanobacterium]
MIRPTIEDDKDGIMILAQSLGLFDFNELQELKERLTLYLNKKCNHLWISDDENGLSGVAYCVPEAMTDRTWNLLLIAIHPSLQRQGRGRLLIQTVEKILITKNARLLLVETSGLAEFKGTREFYRRCGYEEEAVIGDFYELGNDKIIYRKTLAC